MFPLDLKLCFKSLTVYLISASHNVVYQVSPQPPMVQSKQSKLSNLSNILVNLCCTLSIASSLPTVWQMDHHTPNVGQPRFYTAAPWLFDFCMQCYNSYTFFTTLTTCVVTFKEQWAGTLSPFCTSLLLRILISILYFFYPYHSPNVVNFLFVNPLF